MSIRETILVPLAEGFEEIEAVTIIDVLRRAGLPVKSAGLTPGPITGAHGMSLAADVALEEVDPASVGMIVLPGGMPGTTNLAEDGRILSLVRRLREGGKPIAAICAAPMVLAEAGVLEGERATSYPSVQDQLRGARVVAAERVVRSGSLLTSQGPGTALEFALSIVEELCGAEKARELGGEMILAPELAPR